MLNLFLSVFGFCNKMNYANSFKNGAVTAFPISKCATLSISGNYKIALYSKNDNIKIWEVDYIIVTDR